MSYINVYLDDFIGRFYCCCLEKVNLLLTLFSFCTTSLFCFDIQSFPSMLCQSVVFVCQVVISQKSLFSLSIFFYVSALNQRFKLTSSATVLGWGRPATPRLIFNFFAWSLRGPRLSNSLALGLSSCTRCMHRLQMS